MLNMLFAHKYVSDSLMDQALSTLRNLKGIGGQRIIKSQYADLLARGSKRELGFASRSHLVHLFNSNWG